MRARILPVSLCLKEGLALSRCTINTCFMKIAHLLTTWLVPEILEKSLLLDCQCNPGKLTSCSYT